jgi:hypothetical protein
MYRVSRNNVKIGLHERPDSNSAKTGKALAYGECFEVDKTKVVTTDNGKTQTFLHLVAGGWAFEYHPTDGTSVCELWSDEQAAAEVRKRFEKEYTELKADLKKGISSTKHEIAAADATRDYEATVPLKRRLGVFDGLYAKLKTIKPASNFWSIRVADSSMVETHTLLRELDALRLAMPDLSSPTTPNKALHGTVMNVKPHYQQTNDPDAQNPSHLAGSFATTDAAKQACAAAWRNSPRAILSVFN